MLDTEIIKGHLSKTNDIIIKVAAIVGAITVIAGGYGFYMSNIWKPKVQVTAVDFGQGMLQFTFNGKTVEVFGDSDYYLGGDWSIKLGSVNLSSNTKYDSIEFFYTTQWSRIWYCY